MEQNLCLTFTTIVVILLYLGVSIPQGTIRKGARCSTAKAFLSSARKRKNLDIVIRAYVTKVSPIFYFVFKSILYYL